MRCLSIVSSPCACARLSRQSPKQAVAHLVHLHASQRTRSTRRSPLTRQVIVASAFDQIQDTVKEAAKSVDPKKGEPPSMNGKTVVVTGGNSGLGYETAKAISKAGGRVIICSQDLEECKQAATDLQQQAKDAGSQGTVEPMFIDLCDLKSVYDFAEKFNSQYGTLDVLYNNAGVFVPEDGMTKDGFENIVGTNHFGPWYLTQLLIPALKKAQGARIVFTTSPSETQTPDIDFDNLAGVGKQSNLAMYGTTKLFGILSMKEFNRRLSLSGIEVFAAQPGIAKTNLFDTIAVDPAKPLAGVLKAAGPLVGQEAEEGARSMIFAGTNPDMAGKGGDVEHIVGPFYSNLPGLPYGTGNIANIGNTGERPAQNERAYDDSQSKRLYERTGEILSEKVASFDSGRQWA